MPEKLQERPDEAEEAPCALRIGEADAIVTSDSDGNRVYTLKGADEVFRLMAQNMAEGALAVAPDGLILYSNERFASILSIPHKRIIGSSLHEFIVPEDASMFSALLAHKLRDGAKCEVRLKAHNSKLVLASLSVNRLKFGEADGFCVIVADLTDQKRNEEVLHILSARLLRIQDEDRSSIARGLHDGAFQRLAALEFKLTLVSQMVPELPPAAQQNLTECLTLVSECCYELGNLAYLIQPPLLEEQGLEPALRAYIAGFNRKHGPQIRIHFSGRLEKLSPHVEMALFRITQEALANIERHSGSVTADIHFFSKPGGLILEITDHGCGISRKIMKQLNSGTALPGIGIAGMRERIRQIGGFMKISSSSGGTKVTVDLPVNSMVTA